MNAISPWVSCATAASELGVSRETVRRRIGTAAHWKENRHYRWVKKPGRPVILVHLPNVIDLLRVHGW